jgi:GDP-4-dehydro-6-deoxy-D-mannose reductase
VSRFLVTGAGGFLGRHVVEVLRGRGLVVEAAGHGADRSIDFRIAEDVLALVDSLRPTHVVHLAGTSTLAELRRDPQGGNYNVVQPAVNVLDALADIGGARLVLVSPCDVYGRASRIPTDEQSALAPACLYGAARAAVEYMSRAYVGRGVAPVVARVFSFTGPGQDRRWPLGDVAARAARGEVARLGDPEVRRDMSDVRDIATGLVLLAEQGAPGEAYNLCSGAARSMRAMAEEVARAPVEQDPTLAQPGIVPVFLGSASKAEALGWRRVHALSETLADLRASYL